MTMSSRAVKLKPGDKPGTLSVNAVCTVLYSVYSAVQCVQCLQPLGPLTHGGDFFF